MTHSITAAVHEPKPIQFTIHDEETCWINAGKISIFFATANDARRWLTNGVTAVTQAMYAHDNPPEPAPDAHLEPDYDDRNSD